jgi:hypothetical protein
MPTAALGANHYPVRNGRPINEGREILPHQHGIARNQNMQCVRTVEGQGGVETSAAPATENIDEDYTVTIFVVIFFTRYRCIRKERYIIT